MSCTFSYDKEDPTSITFTITSTDNITAKATYCDIKACTVEEFRGLSRAFKEGTNYNLSFCESNGDVSISAYDGNKVLFNCAKYGAGGDGDFSIMCPISMCKAAIKAMVKHRQTIDQLPTEDD